MTNTEFSRTNIKAFVNSLTFGRPIQSYIDGQQPYLQPVHNPLHHGLESLAIYEAPEDNQGSLIGLWVQGINHELQNQGKVGTHKHDVDEFIVIPKGSHYPVTDEIEIIYQEDGYQVYYIPAGTPHGSNIDQTYGNWLSAKVKPNSPQP